MSCYACAIKYNMGILILRYILTSCSIYILNLDYCYLYLFPFDCILYEILKCIFTFILKYYIILSEYFLVHMEKPRWLTCISIICTKVLEHIGDMRRNGIQHHASPDHPFLSSFIVLFN